MSDVVAVGVGGAAAGTSFADVGLTESGSSVEWRDVSGPGTGSLDDPEAEGGGDVVVGVESAFGIAGGIGTCELALPSIRMRPEHARNILQFSPGLERF